MAKALVEKGTNVSDATIQRHIRAISGLKEALDSASGEYRSAVKAAKGDGIETRELLAALAARKREPEDVKAGVKRYVRYLALVNVPVTQLDLFGMTAAVGRAAKGKPAAEQEDEPEDPESLEHRRWEAEESGHKAGLAGHLKDANPYMAGTFASQAWHSGWLRGQEEIANGAKAGVKRASSRRQRSGRNGQAASF